MRADHREPEAPDAAWVDAEAERRRSAFEAERRELAIERAQHREKLPLHERLLAVWHTVSRFATASAGSITSSSRSAVTQGGPPAADPYALGGLHPADVQRYVDLSGSGDPLVAVAAVRALERAVDAHRLGLTSRHTSTLMAEEKDRLILSYEGLSPEAIHALDPDLGDVIVVRRVRTQANRDSETGHRA